tara:strand:- start:12525 stop:13688 length:1164 start_codon:yes stop_codon:yes gene_type:complete
MKFNKIKIVLLLVLPLLGCNVISELKLQSNSDSFVSKKTSIPFSYNKKLIVVNAYLNNSKNTNSFIFDTGAFQSKVEYHLSEELNLKTISKRNNGTAQGIKREIEITSIDTIRLSESRFFNIGAGKLKYDTNSYSPCIAKDGIIGANLIKLTNWKIDYDKKEMEVSRTPFSINTNEEHYNLKFITSFLSGVPKVNVVLDGKVIENVIFDLGFNGGLVVPYKFANQFHSDNTKTIIDQSTAGIFGSNRDTLLVKELNVKLGNFQTKIPVEFSSLNKALLGNDFLEHFTIYLDYKNNKITLVPISNVEVDKVKPFIPGVLNDSLWIVNRTKAGIPLKIGDTLRTINGHKPQDLFQSHCDYFLKISEFLKSDTLHIETTNGIKTNLRLNH